MLVIIDCMLRAICKLQNKYFPDPDYLCVFVKAKHYFCFQGWKLTKNISTYRPISIMGFIDELYDIIMSEEITNIVIQPLV